MGHGKCGSVNLQYNNNTNWKNEACFTTRSFFVCCQICRCRGGMGGRHLEIGAFELRINADIFWRVLAISGVFFILVQYLTQLREVKGQIFAKSDFSREFHVQFWTKWRVVSSWSSNIYDVEHPRKQQLHPHRNSCPMANGVNDLLTLETVNGANKLCENEPRIRS